MALYFNPRKSFPILSVISPSKFPADAMRASLLKVRHRLCRSSAVWTNPRPWVIKTLRQTGPTWPERVYGPPIMMLRLI
jgi:hypothetical protein